MEIERAKNTAKAYINFTLFFAVLNSPLSVIGTFLDVRDLTTYLILISWWLLDLGFILINYKNLKFNFFEIVLLIGIIASTFIGLTYGPNLTRNLITDITNPLFFFLKISLIRQFLKRTTEFNIYIRTTFVKNLVKYSILSSVVTIILYSVLSRFKAMYVGLTPMSHPILIAGMIKGNLIYQITAILVILLSGKRALLLSSTVMFLVYKFVIQGRLRLLLYISAAVFLLVSIMSILNFSIDDIPAFQKYQWTYETFKESDVELNLESGILDVVSGGRLTEINAALMEMDAKDYFIGKGIGFTYTFSSDTFDYELKEHNNLHFTPLSIITKYGLVFYLIVMAYLITCLKGFKRTDRVGVFFGIYIIGSLVDMFFAYIIFVDALLPIAIGYLSSTVNKK